MQGSTVSHTNPGMGQTATHACSAYRQLSMACCSPWLMASELQ